MNLTKTSVERIPTPEKTAFHWDDKLPGFGVRVTPTGIKSFVIQKRIKGKDKRITVGRFGALTVEQGRKEAQKLIGQIATGGDPVADKQRHKLEAVTLEQAFAEYIKRRKTLKASTIKDMYRCLNENLDAWKKTPLTSITPDRVVKQHERIGRRSHARADLTMRYLRAVFNFSMAEYLDSTDAPIIVHNPVTRLSQTRAWFKLKPRQTLIKAHQLTDWFKGVEALTSEVAQDYLQFVILTGLRRTEALNLTWQAVDMKAKTFTCYDTKNHSDHTLPLSDYLMAMLERRKAASVSSYVFAHSNGNQYKCPDKSVKQVVEHSGVKFTMHDLRRTFATIAESLDIPGYALKRLLNHSDGADVTAGYIVADVERLRKPMQQVTDYILRAGGVIQTAEIIPLLGKDTHANG